MTVSAVWVARALTELMAASSGGRDRLDSARLLASQCAEVCVGCDVGVVLTGPGGGPAVSAGSTTSCEALEAWGLREGVGAAVDALRAGVAAVTVISEERWGPYARSARGLGYVEIHSYVLALGGPPLGVINVFRRGGANAAQRGVLQPFVDLAAAHLERDWALRATGLRADQLQAALDSRVPIEQAKGMVAAVLGVPMESAFNSLRRHARDRGQRLDEVCRSLIDGDIDPCAINVEYAAIGAARRVQLRDRAVSRWRQAHAEALLQHERAAAAISRSVELRAARETARGQREISAMRRAVDRHFADSARRPSGAVRPRVLVGDDDQAIRTFAVDALRRSGGFEISTAVLGADDLLAGGIVEQPDLLIFGRHAAGSVEADLLAELRRYCPDSRTLVVVGPGGALTQPADRHVDGVVRCGDRVALVNRARELCGVRVRRDS